MLGAILAIEENTVKVELLDKNCNIVNMYVMMENESRKIIGEIVGVKDDYALINLLGEVIDGKFVFGVIRKPSFASVAKIIPEDKVPLIISTTEYIEDRDLFIGTSPIYENVNIMIDINSFFSNHFAIFGNTGSGKSCSVARLFQNLFSKQNKVAENANILIFDAYGEYHNAFQDLNKLNPKINFKSYTTNLNFPDSELVKIPLWLCSVDDIALLLGAEKNTQLPFIEKALKLVTIFGREEQIVLKHKNDIIARAILDILGSGRPPAQIRDQVFSVLARFNTSELNLDTQVFQPGYTRPLKQLLLIDATGKIREMELLTEFFNSMCGESLELSLPNGTFSYGLEELVDAFDFSLISEGGLKSDKTYDDNNVIRVRLHSLLNSDYSAYFKMDNFINRDDFVKSLTTSLSGYKAQIINFNINYVDDRFAKTITKIYSKLLYDYAKANSERNSMPFHIILEEAHRYVQNDNDINMLGYNIFDRITKEGRKYGVILGLISQRPSELSETTLSQCNNFFIFKMLHPKDINYIKEMVPNITEDVMKNLKILQPGTCVAFGLGFKVPTIIKLAMPDPEPASSSCDISAIWFKEEANMITPEDLTRMQDGIN